MDRSKGKERERGRGETRGGERRIGPSVSMSGDRGEGRGETRGGERRIGSSVSMSEGRGETRGGERRIGPSVSMSEGRGETRGGERRIGPSVGKDGTRNKDTINAELWELRLIDMVENGIITEYIQPDPKERRYLRDDITKYLEIWKTAFTTPTRSVVNYERMEYVGDLLSKAILGELLYSSYPDLTENHMSKLISHYTNNEVQGKIFKTVKTKVRANLKGTEMVEMKATELILWNIENTPVMPEDIISDCYESVFFALYLFGNAVRYGLGFIYCKRFILYHYTKTITIDLGLKVGDPPNELKNIFSRFQYMFGTKDVLPKMATIEEPIIKNDRSSRIHAEVTVTDNMYKFLNSELVKDYDPSIQEDQWGSGSKNRNVNSPYRRWLDKVKKNQPLQSLTDPTFKSVGEERRKKDSKRVAAARALKILAEVGITDKWSDKVKDIFDEIMLNEGTEEPYIKGLSDKLKNVLEEQGYKKYEIDKINKLTIIGNRNIMRLIGINDKGERKLLMTYSGGGNVFHAKGNLAKEYIEKITKKSLRSGRR